MELVVSVVMGKPNSVDSSLGQRGLTISSLLL
jgi:hypothetical protein